MTATVEHLQSGNKMPTPMNIGVCINADTEMDCQKIQRGDGTEFFHASFRSPGRGTGLDLYMSEEDMLRLWFVFEYARQSGSQDA